MYRKTATMLAVSALCISAISFQAAAQGLPAPLQAVSALADEKSQEDYPATCVDSEGTPWVVYLEWNGKDDVLKVAKRTAKGLDRVGTLAGPGIIHQPAIACDGEGVVWAIWSQLNDSDVWNLKARRIVGGKIAPETASLTDGPGNDIFADAGTDRQGRVWVAWQSFRKGLGDIFTRCYDPAKGAWGREIRVTTHAADDWEPRLAFGSDGRAAIAFDSSRDGDFNVYLARVSGDGEVALTQITRSPRYEGRAAIAATPDGKRLWIAWENGRLRWGKDSRGVGGGAGLNARKRIEVVCFDVVSGKLTPAPAVGPVLAKLTAAAKPAPKKQPAKKPAAKKPPAKRPQRKPRRPARVATVNMPGLVVDAGGNPWLTVRCYVGTSWRIALTKYDTKAKAWTQPVTLPDSRYGQDRRCGSARGPDGKLWLTWPSDRRTSKRPLVCGVYLAQIDPAAATPLAKAAAKAPAARPAVARNVYGQDTPERTRADRHTWTVDGKTYRLYWGDFHRHTDMSNCRTADDGCVVEQFRYAYDVGKLDFLGTSDHTDIAGMYQPYQWWHNQKLADVFQTPGLFTSFYVYEREQRWPWGHRNVIFIERNAPMIYIKRPTYKASPWAKDLPVGDGAGDITPKELWDLLRRSGRDCTVISHTGATGMGTDWDLYKQIDNAVENLVEIYQGARVSYEGINTPQPTVGFPRNTKLKADAHGSVKTGKDFGKYNKGVYQNALQNGYKLGVFASSDHIATHTSFGGVYVEEFSRKGILEALNARRTIAGTDKIFVEFSCSGHLLGTTFRLDLPPVLKVAVHGTAPLKRITVIRNEADYKTFTPAEGAKDFTASYTDPAPLVGENRYYIRVEQVDGNMAWTTPVWVTYKGK